MAEPDLSEFAELSGHTKYRRCALGPLADYLSNEDQRALTAALGRPSHDIPAGAIRRWIARRVDERLVPSVPGITAHREGRCACVRNHRG